MYIHTYMWRVHAFLNAIETSAGINTFFFCEQSRAFQHKAMEDLKKS